MRPLKPLLVAAALAVLAACATLNPYYDATQAHHTPQGFRNPDGLATADATAFLRWQWQRLSQERPVQDVAKVPVRQSDKAALAQPVAGWRATWIGHATVLLQVDGVNILTDPIFSPVASPLEGFGPERLVPLPLALKDLPPIDAVVISHSHYDHLDAPTVQALARQPGGPPRYFVPLGLERWFADIGIRSARALDWWQSASLSKSGIPVTFTLVPSQHWSRRTATDTNESLWGGWVIEAGKARAFFAGDTGYGAMFADIGRRFGSFDLAMIPVGCYEPRWFMKRQHVNPEEAVRIHRDVGSRYSLGIHWGTFRLCDEPVEQPLTDLPAARLAAGIAPGTFETWAIGETRRLAYGDGWH